MRSLFFIVCFVVVLMNQAVAEGKKGAIVAFTVEGVQNTELDYGKHDHSKHDFEAHVFDAICKVLAEKYSLGAIEGLQEPFMIRKRPLNRLKSTKRLKKKEQHLAKGYDLVLKVKCDISFDENFGASLLLNTESSRLAVFVQVAVFKNGKFKEKLKGKAKSRHTVLGDNAESQNWLSLDEFIALYEEAITKL